MVSKHARAAGKHTHAGAGMRQGFVASTTHMEQYCEPPP